MYKIIDVSIYMEDFIFPGNPKLDITGPHNRVNGENPEFVYDIVMCSQSGTHVQGSHYFMKDGKKINEYPLERFQGRAYVIDFYDKRGEDITLKEIKNSVDHLNLENANLIIRTGYMGEIIKNKRIEPNRKPGLSIEAAKYLCCEKKINMIAIDSIGLESLASKNYKVNVFLCEQDIIILECLNNLEQITRTEVFLEAFPLKLKNIEGTPCRAIVKEEI